MFGGGNKFLMDHLKRQASLVHEEQEKVDAKKDAKKKKSPHGTASGEPAFPMDLSVLISEKPAKGAVLEYFRNRIATLVAEEMANS